MAEQPAVLLVNHGSRQPHSAAFAQELAAVFRRERPDRIVAVSFLQRNDPSPAAEMLRLAVDGISEVRVVPLLFSAGYHYRIDLGAAVDTVLAATPDLRVHIAPPLLSDVDDLLDAIDVRLGEALELAPTSTARQPDGLMLLAAGSADPKARARVVRLGQAWESVRGLPVETAFCDLGGDDVRAAMALLQARGAGNIACGSLFLAAGRLLDAGRRAALDAGATMVADPLGMTPALTDLIRRRCLEPIAAG